MKYVSFAFIILIFLNSCSKEKINIELIPVEIANKWGYINPKGEYQINPQFSFATSFQNGIAKVKSLGENPKYGFINTEGNYIINPIYNSATVFSEGLACVTTENSSPFYIDETGITKINLPKATSAYVFSEGLALFSEYVTNSDTKRTNKLFGFINKQGQKIIPAQFSDAESFSDGLAAVKNRDNLWGFINYEGKVIINYQFEKADLFSENIASVFNGENWGAINKKGKYIINPIFEKLSRFKEGKAIFIQDGKRGFINKKGKIIINPIFDKANLFINDIACVKINNLWGYIDDKGNFIINPQFDKASPFYGNFAFVKKDEKFGIIGRDGNFIAVPQFNNIYSIIINFPTFDNIGIISYNDLYLKTSYFNAAEILNKVFSSLTTEEVNGISNNTEFLKILKIVNKKSPRKIDTLNFKKYDKEIKVPKIKLNKDISYSANYKFSDYLIKRKYNYYDYSYTNSVNKENNIKSITYKLYLTNNYKEKEEKILNSLIKKYNFLNSTERKNKLYYSGKEFSCSIKKNNNIIIFLFKFHNKNTNNNIHIPIEDLY